MLESTRPDDKPPSTSPRKRTDMTTTNPTATATILIQATHGTENPKKARHAYTVFSRTFRAVKP